MLSLKMNRKIMFTIWCMLAFDFSYVQSKSLRFDRDAIRLRIPRSDDDQFVFPNDQAIEEEQGSMEAIDPFNEDTYTEEEKKCLADRKFWANGKCYKLGSKDPCPPDEWFVLKEPVEGAVIQGPIRPACTKKRCLKNNEFWWPSLQKCETRDTLRKTVCKGSDKLIAVDPYGNGICECSSDSGEFIDRKGCHKYYTRGPCAPNEVVTYNLSSGYAICSKDLCLSYNSQRNQKRSIRARDLHHIGHYKDINDEDAIKNERRTNLDRFEEPIAEASNARSYYQDMLDEDIGYRKKRATKKMFAPFEGTGKCYELYSAEVCTAVGTESRFVVNSETHVPRCSVALQLHLVDAPLLCRVDDNKKCREPVKIQQEDRFTYLMQLKNKILAKSNKK